MGVCIDCEDLESARESAMAALRIKESDLDALLDRIDLVQATAECRQQEARWIECRHAADAEFESVCWFHFTRVENPECFKRDGILTRPCALDGIWSLLRRVAGDRVKDSRWTELREEVAALDPLGGGLDLSSADGRGPHGFLIREMGESPRSGEIELSRKCGEVVQDLCGAVERLEGLNLMSDVIAVTRPYVVKFRTPRPPDWPVVGYLLHHLCSVRRGEERIANSCAGSHYPGYGEPVAASSVVSVCHLPARTRSNGD